MYHAQIVSSCLDAIQRGHLAIAEKFLTDDFVLSGAMPAPLGKRQWFELQAALTKAFPVCTFNLHDITEAGDSLKAKVSIVGVHSGDLDFPGIEPLGPSYKSVVLPEEPITVTFSGDKIAKLELERIPQEEINGILSRIGAHVRTHT